MQGNELAQGVTTGTISLMLGHPDPETLFTPEFQEAAQRVIAAPEPYQSLQYGAERGTPALIDYLVEKFNREQATTLTADDFMLVAGSTHAVDMTARLCAGQGEVVIVEAPSYVDALHVFRDHGVELYSTAMDHAGIIPQKLEQLLAMLKARQKRPRFLYTIPNFHNPMGVTLAEARRFEIDRLAQQYGFVIVEDDVYRDLAFGSDVPRSFVAMGAPALHIGSFSKTLAPGLRLGWLVGSRDLIKRFVCCGTSEMGGGANPFVAQIVAEYCRQGHWERHVSHLRDVYRRRRDTMLAALDQYMPEGVQWTKPGGGFFIWVTLPEHVQGREVKVRALERGVLVAAGEGFFVNPTEGARNLRLTYSFARLEDIVVGVRILGEIIADQMKT